MAGNPDVDAVVDSIGDEQFEEWLAFGYIEGWYPVSKDQGKQVTPQNFNQVFGGK